MRILLISDAIMNKDAGGISQTLYNLFSFAPPPDILCITSKRELLKNPPSEPNQNRYLTYNFEVIYVKGNRFSKYINPFINWFNYSFNQLFRNFKSLKNQIEAYNPDVIISCPNGPVSVFMHNKLLKGLSVNKVIPYFMDDWMYQMEFKWVGGEIHQSIKQLLSNNKAWLMISEDLSKILVERYHIKPESLLEVHNPVDISNAPDVELLTAKKEFKLAYAGALWPMHFDSFKLVAAAVNKLKATMQVNLVLYTSVSFWDWHKSVIEPLGVIYGGSIPYKDIHKKLSEADALILVSSFLQEYSSHSKGSLQTKITDYLKSKRLIISCGPSYSANHNFLKKHDCGICIETNNVEEVALQLGNILENIEDNQKKVQNGWNLLEAEFTFEKIHEKLENFISES
jgi:glycosyltransferase involved in cell wall biosynthesis